jgi:hypothetical protein
MPTYYFHLRVGDRLDRDPEGTELASVDLAVEEVQQAAREMLAGKLIRNEIIDEQIFEIADDAGQVLRTVPLRSVIRFA